MDPTQSLRFAALEQARKFFENTDTTDHEIIRTADKFFRFLSAGDVPKESED